MDSKVQKIITDLSLKPHIEGGYFNETDKSTIELDMQGKNRAIYSNILFLLTQDNPSNFHRLSADKVWYFHQGEALTIHMITKEGNYEQVELSEANPQYCVTAGTIFGSCVDKVGLDLYFQQRLKVLSIKDYLKC